MGQLGFLPILAAVAAPYVAKAVSKLGGKLRKKKKAPAPAAVAAASNLTPVTAGKLTAPPNPPRLTAEEQTIGGVPLRYVALGGAVLLSVVVLLRRRD